MAKGYEVKVLNLNEVIGDFEALENIDLTPTLRKAGVMVQDAAKVAVPKNTGALRDSITHYLPDDKTVIVGSNLNYAPYVEYGTGKFARNGNGRSGWWVFVQGSDGTFRQKERRIYTREEAIRIYWILVGSGIPADRVWITQGQRPQPFLEPALEQNRAAIERLFTAAIKDKTKDNKGRN